MILQTSNCANRYGEAHKTLEARIAKTLVKTLSTPKAFGPQYGSILGFAVLGPRVISVVLMPLLQDYCVMLEDVLGGKDSAENQRDAKRCWNALLNTVGVYLKAMGSLIMKARTNEVDMSEEERKENERELGKQYSLISQLFGDSLLPFIAKELFESLPQ